ncbi:MAG: hypothetical protein KDK44_05175 [Chlamydiia bacterium]|nr:hypothetical protein [Chlamydiia bacterium]MCP5508932.1 hypothetical protein [Chlamydiales bacterium]HPE85139.1 hypothetical protein [Chlamydiales bacterium]
MKEIKLTNELLTKLFRNNFELAMYAVEIGRRYIRSGKEFTLTSLLKDVQDNPLKGDIETLLKEAEEAKTPRATEEDAA